MTSVLRKCHGVSSLTVSPSSHSDPWTGTTPAGKSVSSLGPKEGTGEHETKLRPGLGGNFPRILPQLCLLRL
jgi:hypothetical protein